jgi:hypothetical protein
MRKICLHMKETLLVMNVSRSVLPAVDTSIKCSHVDSIRCASVLLTSQVEATCVGHNWNTML